MGRLKHASFYLTSPVEIGTHVWQKCFADRLREIEPTARVWSPLIKPDWVTPECADIPAALDKEALYKKPDITDPAMHLRRIRAWHANVDARRLCIRLASQCNISIATLPKRFTWGSITELEIAASRGIPTFLIFPEGPVGLFGLPELFSSPDLIHEYIYYSEESLLERLKAITNGSDSLPERDPERWLFITYPNLVNPHGNNGLVQTGN